jgi:hypothetical protein
LSFCHSFVGHEIDVEATDSTATPGEEDRMNKSRAIWLVLIAAFVAAFVSGQVYRNHANATPGPSPAASGAVLKQDSKMSVDTANAYIRISKAEGKLAIDIMKKWDADNDAAKSLAELKQIAIDEGPSLDQAVQHHKKGAELLSAVEASHPASCVESAIKMTDMATADLALEVEKKDLLVESDITTSEGLAKYRRALAPLTAREHAIVREKESYMRSAEYMNACGPND